MPEPRRSQPARTTALRTTTNGVQVEVVRSARRRRTISAYREGERTIVLLPARMSATEEQHWIDTMVARLLAKDARRRPSDTDLARRAARLSERHLDGRAQPVSVRWVGNMRTRWGSATPADRTIRLSDRLQSMPEWVVDYVLVHELAHLLVANHSPRFWSLVARYPRAELARGYLLGIASARDADSDPHGDDIGDDIGDADGDADDIDDAACAADPELPDDVSAETPAALDLDDASAETPLAGLW